MRRSIRARPLVVSALALALAAVAGPVSAQLCPGDDVVGIYATPTGGPPWSHFDDPGQAVQVYIVFCGLSRGGLSGWELAVAQEGASATLVGSELYGEGPLNGSLPPEYRVGLDLPMTEPGADGTFCVAGLTYVVANPTETRLFVRAIEATSWPLDPGPGYAGAEDPDDLVRAVPSSGSQGLPVFVFNWIDLPVEPRTWGAVKGLYP